MHHYDYTLDDLRISDRERKRALAVLDRQHRRGRIDVVELAERADAVTTARTWGDLAPVFADLVPFAAPQRLRRGFARRGFPAFPVLPLLVIGIVLAATGNIPWIPVVVVGVLLVAFAGRRRRGWGHHPGWAC